MALSAPPERKVVYQTGAGVSVAAILYAILNFIPWFNNNLSSEEKQYIAQWLPIVIGAVAGYLAKHTPRLDEVVTQFLPQIEQIEKEYASANAELNDKLTALQAENTSLKSAATTGTDEAKP